MSFFLSEQDKPTSTIELAQEFLQNWLVDATAKYGQQV